MIERNAFGMRAQLIVWGLAVAVVVALPWLFASGSAITLLGQMGVFIVFALSYNMLLGESGMLSFGHAVYFGLGGFATLHALNAVHAGWLWWPLELMPLIGGVAGLLAGIVFGSFSTRRGGVTFAMITLGVGALVTASAHILSAFFGGEGGITANRVTGVSLLPLSYGPGLQVYYLIACWMLVSAGLMYLLRQTPLGRMANAVRDNAERARFVAYNPTMVRFLQFALAGFFAGIAGGLFSILFEIMTAQNLALAQSGMVLLMTYIGGMNAFFGPVIGAIVVTWLQTSLSMYSDGWLLYFGLIFLFMVMYAPAGLAGIVALHLSPWRAGLLRRLLSVYALALLPAVLALAGLIGLVEMGYHLSLAWNPQQPLMLLFVAVNVTHPVPWLIAAALLVVGVGGLRLVAIRIRTRWQQINALLQARTA